MTAAGDQATGKTIRIYLIDGVPTGMLWVEIMNWTGKLLVAPRSQLVEMVQRSEVRRPGVYVLTGQDPNYPSRDRVYIGEGDEVRTRLLWHEREDQRDFWTRTVVIISKDENLTKAHVRYLESRLIELTRKAGRAELDNSTTPAPPGLPEPDRADMEFFLTQVGLVLPVLGLNFTRPAKTRRPETSKEPGLESPTFHTEYEGISARAREVDGEIVVLEGSTARKEGVPSWTSYKELREELIATGQLAKADDEAYFVFTEDVPFSSPSAAAAVVYASNRNGRETWRVEGSGITYKEWQERKLRAETEKPTGLQ